MTGSVTGERGGSRGEAPALAKEEKPMTELNGPSRAQARENSFCFDVAWNRQDGLWEGRVWTRECHVEIKKVEQTSSCLGHGSLQ